MVGFATTLTSYHFTAKVQRSLHTAAIFAISRLPMARHSERSRPIFSFRVAPATRSACAERNLSYIWMMGGCEIIASFLDQGEIDEFRINIIPILIGGGIPLIQPRHRCIRLKLLSTKALS
jgi:dihydrofolate reductase